MNFLQRVYAVFPRRVNWVLISILLLGAVLRLIYINNVPSGLHFDEAQSGYNAFLISKHLKNIHGEFLPTDIDYFQDFRPAGNSYLTALSVSLFGLSETSTRIPSAFFGILTVYIVYLISIKIFRKKKIGYISAFLLAVSPYHIIFSRASTDGIIDLFLIMLSLLLVMNFLDTKRKYLLFCTYLLMLFSFFTYQTSRFMAPVLLILVVLVHFIFYRLKPTAYKWILLLIVVYFVFPWGFYALNGKTGARFSQVSTFSFPEVQRQLNESITEAGTLKIPIILIRTLHNKPLAYLQDISMRHLSFFSPAVVLFDTTRPTRYRIPSMGMFTVIEYFGLVLGVYAVFRYRGNNLKWFALLAIIIAPLPSSITFDDFPNFQRAIYLIPFWEIIAGFGIYTLFENAKKYKKYIFVPFIFLLIFQFIFFIYQYFLIATVHEPFYRNYEQKELALFLNSSVATTYDKIGLSESSGTYIFYLFFNKLDVFKLNVKKEGKYFQGNFSLSNLKFVKGKCLDAGDFLKEEYPLTIQLPECKVFSFSKPIHYFRRKDNSLALTAYKTDKKLFEDFKINNQKLINCRKNILNFYSIGGIDDLGKISDKDTKDKINSKLQECSKTYLVN